MNESDYLSELGKNQITADELTKQVKKDFTLLHMIIEGVNSSNPRIKFGCAKILSKISQENPEKLYSNIDFFIELLNNDNNIIKWNAIDVLANLTQVDKEKKFDVIFSKYYNLINADAMITVAHVVDNSGKIALAKPYLSSKITDELLKLEKIPTKPRVTNECKNILYGKAILAFEKYYKQIENKKEVISFVKRQLKNTRTATKIKAEKFIKEKEIKF
ncbi:MAG: hypothetical protein JSV67_06920 [Thermoplasmatales archaeon]|nr:MAG: hypothetical protein JSV67_06920 [Thermoplasmatales archaeon]